MSLFLAGALGLILFGAACFCAGVYRAEKMALKKNAARQMQEEKRYEKIKMGVSVLPGDDLRKRLRQLSGK